MAKLNVVYTKGGFRPCDPSDVEELVAAHLGEGEIITVRFSRTRNLRFFLERTRQDWDPGDACHARPRMQLLLVISGHHCSVPLPSAANVQVLRVENSGSDLGAYTDALEALRISQEATGWRRLFSYLLFINSSCRGPFLPSYAGKLHWTEPFTSKITAQVKLVGPSIHFIPGCSASWSPALSVWPPALCFADLLLGIPLAVNICFVHLQEKRNLDGDKPAICGDTDLLL